jgi:APA family basic amino acid/polyamine antiporter
MGELEGEKTGLVRGLGALDGALITIGSVLGTGIFLTGSDMARALPHAGLLLLVWTLGGVLTLAGALTYAELGAMFPRAGGMYQFLREGYGPLPAFLFGWVSFLVIMSGGVATIAVGFGEYLGAFIPFFSTRHVLLQVPLGTATWTLSGGQLAAALAILLLTLVNCLGLREGAGVQNAVTVVKVAAMAGLIVLGLVAPASAAPEWLGPRPTGPVLTLLAAMGLAMIGALWTYDGWYNLSFSAGEMRDPGRTLPRGLIAGTLVVTAVYVLVNLVYLRTLPLAAMAQSPRVAESAAAVLFGAGGARWISLAVLVCSFGCLSANILCCSRIYLPMAEDGVFFRAVARVHPRYRVPVVSLLAQGAWSIALTFSATYQQLYTYVVFCGILFHALTGAAVFRLRRARPEAPRPYRVWGYPAVPALFIGGCGVLVVNTLREAPLESGIGLAILALGLPAYAWWRRKP